MKFTRLSIIFLLFLLPLFNCSNQQLFEGTWIPREDVENSAEDALELVIEKVNDSTYDVQILINGEKTSRGETNASGTYLIEENTNRLNKSSAKVTMELTDKGELYVQGLIRLQFFVRK